MMSEDKWTGVRVELKLDLKTAEVLLSCVNATVNRLNDAPATFSDWSPAYLETVRFRVGQVQSALLQAVDAVVQVPEHEMKSHAEFSMALRRRVFGEAYCQQKNRRH